MTEPASQPAAAAAAPGPDALILELGKVLQQLGRNDLAGRAAVAAARLRRPSTIVCVVGEFKQGKSSLVNALLGQQVCPVDDDLATSAITLVRYAEQPGAIVRRR
ncbi:MAG: dynamin family protein, partial [Ilumatobacteraceae bacterium]|nr:dynamin family protein [Ilumatobacteraceae bacterium]